MKNLGPSIKENFPKTYFFLIAIINAFKRILRPYSIYITDSLGGSFKSYFINSNMRKKISELKRNLDKESIETVDVIIQRLLNYPDQSYYHKTTKRKEIVGGLLPIEMNQTKKSIHKKLKSYKRKLKFPSKHIEESVFYYYHGLSLLPNAVAKYIKDQDFIDVGAFIGDSAIALKEYQYKKIYSIELSQKSIERYKVNLAACNINEDKFEIINASIVSNDGETPVKLADTGSSGLSLLRKSGKYDEILVEQKSIDYIVDEYKISPRFIKVDIEGNGLEFVKGANNTLTKFRPVLSIAIYHNPYEFFEVKPLLEKLLNDYVFIVRKLTMGIKNNLCHSEVVLMGYPKEIIN
ncbi:MAG: FkbM family methyltransferase [Bacteroidales bacterium]